MAPPDGGSVELMERGLIWRGSALSEGRECELAYTAASPRPL